VIEHSFVRSRKRLAAIEEILVSMDHRPVDETVFEPRREPRMSPARTAFGTSTATATAAATSTATGTGIGIGIGIGTNQAWGRSQHGRRRRRRENRPAWRDHLSRQVDPSTARDVADCFAAARTRTTDPLIAAAYRQLEIQTDRQYAELTDPRGPHKVMVVRTRLREPYATDTELIEAVRTTGLLEVTSLGPDRRHPLLGGEAGSAYERFQAVHDIVGHVATGFGFDQGGEYSAWLVQRRTYHGLARWAAATELHGENSVLSTTHEFADHKAILLDLELLDRPPLPAVRRAA
jgi:hypothetical protein